MIVFVPGGYMPNVNLSENIANKIKHKIITGEYKLGQQLPNEQELCSELNISRTTVREAIKLLVSKNVLEIERGRGTFVAAVPGLSEDPFGLEFVNDDELKTALCEFRNIVEPYICGLAAKNATEEQLKTMAEHIVKMEEITSKACVQSTEEWIDEFVDLEINFHVLLYKMSGNLLFERMTELVARSVVINCTGIRYRRNFDFEKYCELHTTLYNCIAERAHTKAVEMGKDHCLGFDLFL